MAFSTFAVLYNHGHRLDPEQSWPYRESPPFEKALSIVLLPHPRSNESASCVCGFAEFGHCIYREPNDTWSCCVWLRSLSVMFSRFVHGAAWVSPSFLFTAEWHSTVFCLFSHRPVGAWIVPPSGCCKECCYEHSYTSFGLKTCFQLSGVCI